MPSSRSISPRASIDGSFIRNLANDPIDRAMVDAINGVGHEMNLSTFAEFVENDGIIAVLLSLGVDYAQGYGIAVPTPLWIWPWQCRM